MLLISAPPGGAHLPLMSIFIFSSDLVKTIRCDSTGQSDVLGLIVVGVKSGSSQACVAGELSI